MKMGESFNPCSNGLSAQRVASALSTVSTEVVSILVLMDFRLKGQNEVYIKVNGTGFNPCSNGLSAQR